MYTLIDKNQEYGVWNYNFFIDKFGSIETITSRLELSDEELNNFIIEYINDFESNYDYSDYANILKENIQYYNKYGEPILGEL